jgi:hypothetical protein
MFMRNTFLFYTFIVIFTFTSCTTYRYIYSASPANNPYFTEKGESKLTAYYSSSNNNPLTKEYAHGVDLQGAYAIGNHWALTAGYFNRRERDVYRSSFNLYDSSVVQYKRNLFDFGGGYFITLNTKKNITANLYAGFASGKFSFDDNGLDKNQLVYNRYHESAITKWFFQPSINFMPGRYVRFSFAAKFSYVHYGKIQTSYTSDELQYFGLDRIANRTITFFEPSLNIQFGISKYPWIKIDAVYSGTSNVYHDKPRLDVRSPNGSIGLSFDFSKMKKKNN